MASTTPPPADAGGPEYLDQSGGRPAAPSGSGTGGRRTALAAGAAVVGLGLVGGGVWAAMSFFATGAQPAEALPAGTVGYMSVDLDPSGGQKIEAFRMLQKFPAIEKELGGFDADDDILAKAFEESDCEGLDYQDDVKPWLGYRFAVAAVDVGEEMPAPVGVLQVTDADGAEDGLAALLECGGESGGFVVEGDWAVVAETQDIAEQVTEATADGTLADDETYQEWTDEVGDAGVVTMYAAPAAGDLLAELVGSFGGTGMVPGLTGELAPLDPEAPTEELPEEMTEALKDFEGMAATLRFDDGALELEAAGSSGNAEQMQMFASDRGAEVVATLPEDTAVALGFAFADGWVRTAAEQAVRSSGGEMTVEDLEAELQAATGLTIEDLETLTGDSAALALGSDVTMESFVNSTDGSDIPVGAKVDGDGAAISDVLGKITESMGSGAEVLGSDADGDLVAIGPNPDYRARLLEDGELGDTDVFQNVVREADEASAVVFVNFDAGDWLTSIAEGDQEAAANLEPLQGLGLSSWSEDDASHVVFRLTTD